MPLRHVQRYYSPAGFVLTAVVFASLAATFVIRDVRMVRTQMENALVREGLSIIATFEASARAAMSGKATWNAERLDALMHDTCARADLAYFAFVDPKYRVFLTTATNECSFQDNAMSNIYLALAATPYVWQRVRDARGAETLNVVKPLLLDQADRIGRRTYRFYQVLLNRRGRGTVVRDLPPENAYPPALPLAIVALPIEDMRAVLRRTAARSIITGASIFIVGTLLLYLLTVIQQNRIVERALGQARADNERLLASLRRTDRLAVLGRMAATIAHEIGNPLGAVRGFTQLFRAHACAEGNTKMCEHADVVVQEIDRLNSVITGVRHFSRPVEPQFQLCALPLIVAHTLELIKADAAARHVALVSHVPATLPPVPVDRNLITQALLNLFINALDAMPAGGALTVEAHVAGAGALHLLVRDTGAGIPKHLLKTVFEPFFSTKPTGTGLGLAVVENIIAEHGGAVWVESEPHKGSTFHIELPLSRTGGV